MAIVKKSPALSSKRCYRVSCFLFVPTWSGLKFPWVHLHKLNYLMVSLIPPRPLLALVLLQHLQYGSCVLRVMRLGAICKNINFSVVYFFPRKGRFFGFTTWSSDFYCPPWRHNMIKLGMTKKDCVESCTFDKGLRWDKHIFFLGANII